MPVEKLSFKKVVIISARLKELMASGVRYIIFQHINKKGDEDSHHHRHKYKLTAYYLEGTSYVKVTGFFYNYEPPVFIDIEIGNEATNESFGNLVLDTKDLPSVDIAKYKYLILMPVIFQDDDDYVSYKMYYAETPEDALTEKNIEEEQVVPVQKPLDPSPPAR